MAKRGRPKGSKNKTHKRASAVWKSAVLDRKASYFADLFISSEHINGAEKLAQRVLEKIRANKIRLTNKYGKE